MAPDPHELITEAHHQVRGLMALLGEREELQPMQSSGLYYLLKAVDQRLKGAIALLEHPVPPAKPGASYPVFADPTPGD